MGYYFDYGQGDFWGLPYGIALDDGGSVDVQRDSDVALLCDGIRAGAGGQRELAHLWLDDRHCADGSGNPPIPEYTAHFAKFSWVNPWGVERDYWAYGVGCLSDSEFYNGGFDSYESSFYVTNCLFWRGAGGLTSQESDVGVLTLENCKSQWWFRSAALLLGEPRPFGRSSTRRLTARRS